MARSPKAVLQVVGRRSAPIVSGGSGANTREAVEGADDRPRSSARVDQGLDLGEHCLAGFRVGHRPTVRVGPLELRVVPSRVALVPAVAMDRRLCELWRGDYLFDERGNKLLVCGDRVVRSRQSVAAEHVMDLVEEAAVSGRSDLVDAISARCPPGRSRAAGRVIRASGGTQW